MGAGAGMMLDAVRRQRQVAREMTARRRRARPLLTDPHAGERTNHPCHYLCADCGYLAESDIACPSCGAPGLMDLGRVDVGEALRAVEWKERMGGSFSRKPTVLVSLFLWAFTALCAFIHLHFNAPPGLQSYFLAANLFGAFLLGLIPAALFALWLGDRFGAYWSRRDGATTTLTRWRLPLVEPDTRSEIVRSVVGVAQADATVPAPLTGRACLAYELIVRFDAVEDASPAQTVLHESHAVGFAIGGLPVDAERAVLELSPEHVDEMRVRGGEEALARFLRSRGLFYSEGDFTLYESIVRPGDQIQASFYAAPTDAGPVLHLIARG